ncbi:MAG: glycosyltransferase family 2 protein [Bradymonadia bacterium]
MSNPNAHESTSDEVAASRAAPRDVPTVSIIMPAYNMEAYIANAIESVLNQTVPATEILVVDDGSTDRTTEIVKSFGDKVRLFEQDHLGPYPARNLAGRYAVGEWLAYLDADDTWLPNKLERQFEYIRDDVALIYTDRYNTGVLAGLPDVHSHAQPMYSGDVFETLLAGNYITTSSVLLRASVLHELGGFSMHPELAVGGDWDMWLRVAAEHQVIFIDEPLVNYLLHAQGVSRNLNRMLKSRMRSINRALSSPRGQALDPSFSRQILAATHRCNGWDANRLGNRKSAMISYVQAAMTWPFEKENFLGLARTVLKR